MSYNDSQSKGSPPTQKLGLCSPIVQETGVQSQVESYQRLKKWYLMPPCLTKDYKAWIKDKWSNPGKGVVPSPTPQCISYWKRSLWVTPNHGQPTYLLKTSLITHLWLEDTTIDWSGAIGDFGTDKVSGK